MPKKKVLVLGMARSGYEAAKLLARKNYDVIVNDARAEQNTEQIKELQSLGVTIILGSHPEDLFDNSFEMIVKNPGVPNHHIYVQKANAVHVPVINEMELAFRYFPAGVKIIGVTGSNGKTTTTTIIYEILKNASEKVFLMGNIGYPVCSFVSQLRENDIAVMEVSDHQLCNVQDYKTNISVLTNLSKAHLDFHGSYDAYINIKKRIFNHHTKADIAILNLDNDDVIRLTENIASTRKYFSSNSSIESGCSIINGYICYNNCKIVAMDEMKMKGKHNYENAMAAITVVKEFDVDDQVIIDVLTSFTGIEHRMEYVDTINGIAFYNDSKSTNVASTQAALSSFDQPVILLLGGLDRGHGFAELKDYLSYVKLIVAYGETKARINEFALECGIPCKAADSLEDATKSAYHSAEEGYAVLLSPACAAWDQFKDFEARGNMYKEYVNKLRKEG